MVYTGFGYEFNSLLSEEDELNVAFKSMITGWSASMTPSRWAIRQILIAFAPILLKFVRVSSLLVSGRSVVTDDVALALCCRCQN